MQQSRLAGDENARVATRSSGLRVSEHHAVAFAGARGSAITLPARNSPIALSTMPSQIGEHVAAVLP
jgi:hypothetical protein